MLTIAAQIAVGWSIPLPAAAQAFTDIDSENYLYEAVEFLHARGIMRGYDDGTFRPRNSVNRAEALKIIVAAVDDLDLPSPGTSSYSDIPANAWYQPYVEAAWTTLRVINGPPSATRFRPADPVAKHEFLKMFLLSQKVDVKGFLGEVQLPLAYDAPSTTEWYYPYLRYAVATSMTEATEQGELRPDRDMNRGAVALFLYRYFQYHDDAQVNELLTQMEVELVRAVQLLDKGDLAGADYATARAKLQSRGAMESVPEEPLAKGAVKVAEAYRHIVKAYQAGAQGKYDTAISEAGMAWNEAQRAREFSPSYERLAAEIQGIAKHAADTSRQRK